MKKTKYSAYFLLFVCITILTGLVSCSDDKSNAAGSKVQLLSFGPCPIPRGGELRVIGNNLDQVQSVSIPGSDAVANSSFTMKTPTEIRLIVPKTAEEGQIALNVGGGGAITSITSLTIDGSIVLNGFSPLSAKAGDVIKIEGEDLDFAKEVIFSADIHVVKDSFISQSLQSIEVRVPLEAQTGKLAISGPVQENTITVYLDSDLTVTLPTITAISPETIRAGNVMTITGKDFDLVKNITFGGTKIADSFITNSDFTSITVTVPVDAQDGPVVLSAFSGVKVSSADNLTMVVPTITSVSPTSIQQGDTVTITGTDLDLVSTAAFGGGKQPGQIVPGGTLTEIKVVSPVNAKDGTIVLTTLANKTVETDPITIKQAAGNETTVWGEIVLSGWNNVTVPYSAFGDNLQPNDVIRIYFSSIESNGEIQVFYGDWGAIGSGIDVKPAAGDEYYEILLTADMIDHMKNPAWGAGGILMQGDGLTISKITVVSPVTEKVIWQGSVGPIEWNGDNYCGPIDVSDLSAGQTLGIDFTCDPSAGYWQMEAMVGSWWTDFENWAASNGGNNQPKFDQTTTNVEFIITQTDIDGIQAEGNALLFAGNGIIITRIYVK